jgi:hypothetical protein
VKIKSVKSLPQRASSLVSAAGQTHQLRMFPVAQAAVGLGVAALTLLLSLISTLKSLVINVFLRE